MIMGQMRVAYVRRVVHNSPVAFGVFSLINESACSCCQCHAVYNIHGTTLSASV